MWPAGAQPDVRNAEIVRVTAISTDTLAITRAQEGSTARGIIAGDQIAACPPSYAFQLVNSQSDWSELDTVVDYIRDLRGVDKVALVSWSQGSFRVGPYAVQHPEKVDSLLLYAPIYNHFGRAGTGPDGFGAPGTLPQPGTPMTLRTRDTGLLQLWNRELGCEDQIDVDGVQDTIWSAIMDNDSIGRTWGPPAPGAPDGSPPDGIMRVRSPFLWGWNANTASRLSVPVLIIYGEFDTQVNASPFSVQALYADITQAPKLLFKVQCAGHFMVWERQRRVLHHISKEWLTHGTVEGFDTGIFFVDTEGVIH